MHHTTRSHVATIVWYILYRTVLTYTRQSPTAKAALHVYVFMGSIVLRWRAGTTAIAAGHVARRRWDVDAAPLKSQRAGPMRMRLLACLHVDVGTLHSPTIFSQVLERM
jgi:hypothetical protein